MMVMTAMITTQPGGNVVFDTGLRKRRSPQRDREKNLQHGVDAPAISLRMIFCRLDRAEKHSHDNTYEMRGDSS